MKNILKKGKIMELLSDNGSRGWSKEAHLLTHGKKKYMLRRTINMKKAREYEQLSRKLEKCGFLPKFLGRYGKDVIFEYIEGRDLRQKESLKIIRQVGKISAQINKLKANSPVEGRIKKQIMEAVTGEFKQKGKKSKPLLTRTKAEKIKKLYFYLKKKAKPTIMLDLNDSSPNNFRLRKGKVYFVDIEAIKARHKGYSFGKAFTKWFKTKKEREAFLEGYAFVASTKFLTEHYLDFIYLIYLIQEVNYTCLHGKKYKPRYKTRLEFLDELLKKYEGLLK